MSIPEKVQESMHWPYCGCPGHGESKGVPNMAWICLERGESAWLYLTLWSTREVTCLWTRGGGGGAKYTQARVCYEGGRAGQGGV